MIRRAMRWIRQPGFLRTFPNRVLTAAALAVAAVNVLFVNRADLGVTAAAGPLALLGAAAGFFTVSYLGVCLAALATSWLEGFRAEPRDDPAEPRDPPVD
jgi:hypothetical protein